MDKENEYLLNQKSFYGEYCILYEQLYMPLPCCVHSFDSQDDDDKVFEIASRLKICHGKED